MKMFKVARKNTKLRVKAPILIISGEAELYYKDDMIGYAEGRTFILLFMINNNIFSKIGLDFYVRKEMLYCTKDINLMREIYERNKYFKKIVDRREDIVIKHMDRFLCYGYQTEDRINMMLENSMSHYRYGTIKSFAYKIGKDYKTLRMTIKKMEDEMKVIHLKKDRIIKKI